MMFFSKGILKLWKNVFLKKNFLNIMWRNIEFLIKNVSLNCQTVTESYRILSNLS